jgi:hypothetical protein
MLVGQVRPGSCYDLRYPLRNLGIATSSPRLLRHRRTHFVVAQGPPQHPSPPLPSSPAHHQMHPHPTPGMVKYWWKNRMKYSSVPPLNLQNSQNHRAVQLYLRPVEASSQHPRAVDYRSICCRRRYRIVIIRRVWRIGEELRQHRYAAIRQGGRAMGECSLYACITVCVL